MNLMYVHLHVAVQDHLPDHTVLYRPRPYKPLPQKTNCTALYNNPKSTVSLAMKHPKRTMTALVVA